MPNAASLLSVVTPGVAPPQGASDLSATGVDLSAFGKLLLASAATETALPLIATTAEGVATIAQNAPTIQSASSKDETAAAHLMLVSLPVPQPVNTPAGDPIPRAPGQPSPDAPPLTIAGVVPGQLQPLLTQGTSETPAVDAEAETDERAPLKKTATASDTLPASPLPVQPETAAKLALADTASTSIRAAAPVPNAPVIAPEPSANPTPAAPTSAGGEASSTPPVEQARPAQVAPEPGDLTKTLPAANAEAPRQALTAVLTKLDSTGTDHQAPKSSGDKPAAAPAVSDKATPPATPSVPSIRHDAGTQDTGQASPPSPQVHNETAAAANPGPPEAAPRGAGVAPLASADPSQSQAATPNSAPRTDTALPVVIVRTDHATKGSGAESIPAAQVAVAIARQMRQGSNHFEIRLDPPELGRIDVRMEVTHQGRVMATLAADRPETLDLLQRDARSLQRALTDAGLDATADSLNFTMREGRDQQRGSFGTGGDLFDGAPAEIEITPVAPAYVASLAPGRIDMRV